VIFFQPGEIKIAKNIAQQDELLEMSAFQRAQSIGGAAGLRAQVQVGNDERMAKPIFHCLICSASMLNSDEGEVKFSTQESLKRTPPKLNNLEGRSSKSSGWAEVFARGGCRSQRCVRALRALPPAVYIYASNLRYRHSLFKQ
jgi:hypothetical protein